MADIGDDRRNNSGIYLKIDDLEDKLIKRQNEIEENQEGATKKLDKLILQMDIIVWAIKLFLGVIATAIIVAILSLIIKK